MDFLRQLLSMLLAALREQAPEVKAQLVAWAREKAQSSETPWDDFAVDVLAMLLGVDE